jgi:hypothetical protein
LKDFYKPYRPAAWFFEVVEYAKKFLVIGIIPATQGDVVGAVIAMLVVNVYLVLLVKMEPFASRLDNLLAACLNALLSIVILISVLLKLDSAYLLGQTSDGFNTETAAALLISCNVLVVVMSIVAYWISVRHSGTSGDAGEMASSIQEMEMEHQAGSAGNMFQQMENPADWDSEVGELTTPYRKLPGAVSKKLRTSQTEKYVVGSQAELADPDVNGWWVREVLPDHGASGPGFIIVTSGPDEDYA